MTTYYHYTRSPIGKLLLAGDGDCLSLLGFPSGSMSRKHEKKWVEDISPFRKVIFQLESYFQGELQDFHLSLTLEGTKFQIAVWEALTKIPYGETRSYGDLAKHIGRPKAFRAVGAANSLNPIPLIIPCHRVISSNGKLAGFGGGIKTKEYLLNLEKEVIAPSLIVT